MRVPSVFVTRQRNENAYRLVGFSEYATALNMFTKLVSISNDQELQEMDEMIKDHPSLTVFTNLSRGITPPTSTIAETALNQEERYDKQGLAWMMALARVEYGAMVAGFTDIENHYHLETLGDDEEAAFKELLLDGVRMHYFSMVNEPLGRLVLKGNAGFSEAFGFGRRAIMVRSMINALAEFARDEFNPAQQQELANINREVGYYADGSIASVSAYLMTNGVSNASFDSDSLDLRGCGAIVRGIRGDLAAGRARIIRKE
ncbi:MAG TPA: hypothetical protein DIT88_06115 [Planctomycetaceae bacterium]|nr:hypothetical protein [Pirellulales bacterium]HCP83960.1 hypothetical protein [Planctomycetaceae bacterium]